MPTLFRPHRFALLAIALLLGGCEFFGGEGQLSLQLSDAPVDELSAVVVTVDRVELEPADGGDREKIKLDPPVKIDLLQQRDGQAAALLTQENVPAGSYRSIRLRLRGDASSSDESYVQLKDGSRRPLFVPEDDEDRLEVDADFDIDEDELTELTLDIDLRASLREPDNSKPNAYRLVPRLRAIENRRSGTISGSIAARRVDSDCTPAVYVYSGDVTPDDVGSKGAEPLSSTIPAEISGGGYQYTLAFLSSGDYTVAFTCDADRDDPEDDDDLDFDPPEDANVRAGQTTTLDFD